ncbi:RDD family protein [Ostreibacterium oceani]|uniref:DUF3592 domain-containing protein n=1 Tax=Ostreibacterium oceani TaxID=2654998 RepID=A0A6N7EVR2_9GAMM|nr:RDD family protein [Ostreibacterium oceani]MPV85167.1 DUF3592 domain-containing protein [Ostreibacterium oceani]
MSSQYQSYPNPFSDGLGVLLVFFGASLMPLITLAFALPKYGYLNSSNHQWVETPVTFERLDVSRVSNWRDREWSLDVDYQYVYDKKNYFNNRLAGGFVALPTQQQAEALVNKLKGDAIVWVNPKKPSQSVLIRRKDYIDLGVNDPVAKAWGWIIASLPILFPLVFMVDSILGAKKNKKDIAKENWLSKYAQLNKRMLSVWIDFVIFSSTIVVIIAIKDIYYLSHFTAKPLALKIYINYGLPITIFSCWLVFGRTLGMLIMNLRVRDIATLEKPTFMQWMLRVLGTFMIFALAGIPLLVAAFDKKKQTIADKLSGTVVIQGIKKDRYMDTRFLINNSIEFL